MSYPKNNARCWEDVFAGPNFYRQCENEAKYEHEGLRYCKKHHPPSKRAKLEAELKRMDSKIMTAKQLLGRGKGMT